MAVITFLGSSACQAYIIMYTYNFIIMLDMHCFQEMLMLLAQLIHMSERLLLPCSRAFMPLAKVLSFGLFCVQQLWTHAVVSIIHNVNCHYSARGIVVAILCQHIIKLCQVCLFTDTRTYYRMQ